ncbi:MULTISPECIES: hypothetical protein [unclassified Clostridium]|uniref:hypothetical protein n=1 Tax=unclassified Clostridium TaxID=2614128 RepID=UPI0002DBF5D0|nr:MULTISPECIES: hypothetical protein [unclassified Clostridium]
MKSKIILLLLSALLVTSMIGCGSKDKQTVSPTDSKVTASADDDIEIKKDYGEDIELISKNYLKAIDSNTKGGFKNPIIGKVTEDKGNHSKVEGFDKSKDGKTVICYLDTSESKDLKLGDVVRIDIKDIDKNDDDSNEDPTEFKYGAEPMSMDEYNKKISERVGDTRDKSTKDNYVYLKDTKENSYFVPELSMATYQDMLRIITTPVLDKQNLSSIQGEYDGEVVLIDIKHDESMVVAVKVNDKYEYFCVSLTDMKRLKISDEDYKIRDKVKVIIGIYPYSTEEAVSIK